MKESKSYEELPEMLSACDISKHLGISLGSSYKLLKSGDIPVHLSDLLFCQMVVKHARTDGAHSQKRQDHENHICDCKQVIYRSSFLLHCQKSCY